MVSYVDYKILFTMQTTLFLSHPPPDKNRSKQELPVIHYYCEGLN